MTMLLWCCTWAIHSSLNDLKMENIIHYYTSNKSCDTILLYHYYSISFP